MAFRFIHSADVHLDSPLRSLALLDERLAELIGNATRQAFQNIVTLCIDEEADALLLAGDLYDGDQTSMKTATFFAQQMHRLNDANVKVFVVRGNHDAESRITKQLTELTLPPNVTVFKGRAGCVEISPLDGGPPLAIHGMSFAEPQATASLLPHYKPPVAGAVIIGMLHTSMAGAEGHNTYAPCTLAELRAHGYRYWALGHVHKRSVFDGACTVVMPGNPQGRDINEAGVKTATLVTIGDDGSLSYEERLTSVAEFERIPVSVDGCDDWAAVVRAIQTGLEAARDKARSEQFVCRLILSGGTPAAWELRYAAERLKGEADVLAERIGKTWIEKIDNNCKGPSSAAAAGDALAELTSEIEGGILDSDAYALELDTIAKELLHVLPRETQAAIGDVNEEAFKAQLKRLAQEGADEVLARLRATEATEKF